MFSEAYSWGGKREKKRPEVGGGDCLYREGVLSEFTHVWFEDISEFVLNKR